MVTRWSSRRGQSMGEYAILFAIVLGAAIAMQQYVKSRLQGAVAFRAQDYSNSAGMAGAGFNTFEPDRETDSVSDTGLAMTSVNAGNVTIDSQSDTTVTK